MQAHLPFACRYRGRVLSCRSEKRHALTGVPPNRNVHSSTLLEGEPTVLMRLRRSLVLLALASTFACGRDNPVSPATGSQLPEGTATLALAGSFSRSQRDSVAQQGMLARFARVAPSPAGARSANADPGSTFIAVTWFPNPSGTGPEPRTLGVRLPLDVNGIAPQTFQFGTGGATAVIPAERVNGGSVSYEATAGSITIETATERSITGVIAAGFAIGPPGSRLILNGRFNATVCANEPGVFSDPCTVNYTY